MVPLNPRRANIAQMPERISGFRGEFLWEWDIAERQLLQLKGPKRAGRDASDPDDHAIRTVATQQRSQSGQLT
jgi:hypothetical protein